MTHNKTILFAGAAALAAASLLFMALLPSTVGSTHTLRRWCTDKSDAFAAASAYKYGTESEYILTIGPGTTCKDLDLFGGGDLKGPHVMLAKKYTENGVTIYSSGLVSGDGGPIPLWVWGIEATQ